MEQIIRELKAKRDAIDAAIKALEALPPEVLPQPVFVQPFYIPPPYPYTWPYWYGGSGTYCESPPPTTTSVVVGSDSITAESSFTSGVQ